MEKDKESTPRENETLPPNDEQPSLDNMVEDPGAPSEENGASSKTLAFPGAKSASSARRLDDNFGKPDAALFPDGGAASAAENGPGPAADAAMPLQDGTGWENSAGIAKPSSLSARMDVREEHELLVGDLLADDEATAESENPAAQPRRQANVTPFPGTVLQRAPDLGPAELLRGGTTSADMFEEISAHAGDEPETAEPVDNHDALADAVQSALRNIYGGYTEPRDDGADQGYTVADALAGDAAGEEPAWPGNRARAADWRASRASGEDAEPDGSESPDTEGALDLFYNQRRLGRATTEMSLNDYAARGDTWPPEPDLDEPEAMTPFAARERDGILRGNGPDFEQAPSIIHGGSYSPMDAQWGASPYVAPQNARGTITPTYVPATATQSDPSLAQGPDSGHLLGAAGLGLIGGIALAGVLAVFVFNSFVDESGQSISDPTSAKVVERLSPAQTGANPALARSAPDTRIEAGAAPSQTAAATPPARQERPQAEAGGKPKLLAATASGAPDTPIKFNILLTNGDVGDALVSLKGLPKEARLSTGIDVGGGQWLLPPGRLKDLTVSAPANTAGTYQLEAQLLKDDAQTSLSDAVPFTLSVGAPAAARPSPGQPAPGQAAAALTPNTAKPAASRLALLPDEAPLPETDFLTQVLIRDGNKKMRDGDIAGARRLYEEASQSGNAEAALAMGRSFDPTYFEKLTVKTGKPDPATAFEWYKKALDGGLVTARVKIDALKQWLQR